MKRNSLKLTIYMAIFIMLLIIAIAVSGMIADKYIKESENEKESQEIIETFNKILRLANPRTRRGINYVKEIAKNGTEIQSSITKIRENMSVEDFEEIKKILNSDELKVERYINSFISGSVLLNNELIIDSDFNLCQEKFYEMQTLIKKKLEDTEEKLK